MLACVNMEEESRTALFILESIRALQSDREIKLHAVVTDNGSNMVKALRDGNFTNIRCMAHTINLMVQNALRHSDSNVENLLSKARTLVSHFRRSSRCAEMLKQYQITHAMPKHKLLLDVSTRWNSTFYMLERLHQQREAINLLSVSRGICETLTFDKWQLCSHLIEVLQVFEVATKELSSDVATLSHVLPLAYNLMREVEVLETKIASGQLQGVVGNFLASLKGQMLARFAIPSHKDKTRSRQSVFTSEKIYNTCVIAAILDPRLKLQWCGEEDEPLFIRLFTAEAAKFETTVTADAKTVDSSSSDDNTESLLFRHQQQDDPTTSLSGSSSDATNVKQTQWPHSPMSNQIFQYLAAPRMKSNKNPLEFWSKCSSKWPGLFCMAMTYLCCPPTSVASKRLFSSSGAVDTPLRNRLKPKHIEMLTFLHVNLKKRNFIY